MIYRYRISEADGSDAGEAHYAVLIQPGETIHASDGRKLRVIAVVATEDEARQSGPGPGASGASSTLCLRKKRARSSSGCSGWRLPSSLRLARPAANPASA